jgi:hypothetical protein
LTLVIKSSSNVIYGAQFARIAFAITLCTLA